MRQGVLPLTGMDLVGKVPTRLLMNLGQSKLHGIARRALQGGATEQGPTFVFPFNFLLMGCGFLIASREIVPSLYDACLLYCFAFLGNLSTRLQVAHGHKFLSSILILQFRVMGM